MYWFGDKKIIHEYQTLLLFKIREDSARQVARSKERCETMRRSMQGQIAEMERQLAQCRATARAAQRDRDEVTRYYRYDVKILMDTRVHL